MKFILPVICFCFSNLAFAQQSQHETIFYNPVISNYNAKYDSYPMSPKASEQLIQSQSRNNYMPALTRRERLENELLANTFNGNESLEQALAKKSRRSSLNAILNPNQNTTRMTASCNTNKIGDSFHTYCN